MIVLQESSLPNHGLNDIIKHCSNIKQFHMVLQKYHLLKLTIACTKNFLVEVALILNNYSINMLYVLSKKEVMWPSELDLQDINYIQVQTTKQLMRYLCLGATLLFHQQSIAEGIEEDHGLKNMQITQAIRALNSARNFI